MLKPNPISVDVDKALREGKYTNITPYPDTPRKPKEPAIFEMRAGDLKTPADMENLARQRKEYEDALIRYDIAKKEHEEKAKVHREESQRLEALFKADCEATCFGAATGTLAQRKKDKVWEKAWEHGHADGYMSIWHWYQEFYEVASII